MLGNHKYNDDMLFKSAIHKLNCSKCSKCYIGQTECKFNYRFKEHTIFITLETISCPLCCNSCGPVLWPLRSLDLTIADFKQIVYANYLPSNIEDLERIRDALASFHLRKLVEATGNWVKNLCKAANGLSEILFGSFIFVFKIL